VKFEFMAKHRVAWPVNLMCEALGVSRSGFYAWLVRPRSRRSREDEVLGTHVRQSFVGSDRTYGSRRVWHDVLALGHRCGLHRIERLMREQALRARPRRRGLPKDLGERSAIADNILDRQFAASAPNQKWVADITYIDTAEGWLYLASILDLYSRRVVGWAMSERIDTVLVLKALAMALLHRNPPANLLFHSDRGVQYASGDYRQALSQAGLIASMSRSGNCYDNAAMESFWSTLKMELVYRQCFATRGRACQIIFDYIEVFYNRQRIHSSLGYASPYAFENQNN